MWFLEIWTWVVRLALLPTEPSPHLNFEILFVFHLFGDETWVPKYSRQDSTTEPEPPALECLLEQ